jgi:hypothetical protein
MLAVARLVLLLAGHPALADRPSVSCGPAPEIDGTYWLDARFRIIERTRFGLWSISNLGHAR